MVYHATTSTNVQMERINVIQTLFASIQKLHLIVFVCLVTNKMAMCAMKSTSALMMFITVALMLIARIHRVVSFVNVTKVTTKTVALVLRMKMSVTLEHTVVVNTRLV